jgi:hypothetical protein
VDAVESNTMTLGTANNFASDAASFPSYVAISATCCQQREDQRAKGESVQREHTEAVPADVSQQNSDREPAAYP